jgi:hypothetical protein
LAEQAHRGVETGHIATAQTAYRFVVSGQCGTGEGEFAP